MLNDDEIVTSVQKESDPVNDETNEDDHNNNNESSKGSTNADAFFTLETAMEWYEQHFEGCPTQLLLLKRISDIAAKKRRLPGFIHYMDRIRFSGRFPVAIDSDKQRSTVCRR
ncbi:uncharacterized protein TNCV_3283291 [Trichonephila clavipes]|nr:uncharacterized protein TNCV_3283291 [Trichonephila clavipes]